MTLKALHDKALLARYFRQTAPHLHVYSIGDLDDFFWPYTQWYGVYEDEDLRGVILLYMGSSLPNVLLLHHEPETLRHMAEVAMPYLPQRFYAHLSPGAEEILAQEYDLVSHGLHHKMGLLSPDRLEAFLVSAPQLDVSALGTEDLDAIQALYDASYPGNWFNPRMVETGCYKGIWEQDRLVSIAGIHVYSARYRVAALGNVTTHPEARGRGYARLTTAALCRQLHDEGLDVISLNVKADNQTAIKMYQELGFSIVADYVECMATPRLK